VSDQLHAPAALLPGKSPRYPFYRRLGGPQSRSGRYGEAKIFYPTGTRTPAPLGRPAHSQSLYRLRYTGSLSGTGHNYWFGHGLLSTVHHLYRLYTALHEDVAMITGLNGKLSQWPSTYYPSIRLGRQRKVTKRCPQSLQRVSCRTQGFTNTAQYY
jgi:hypothetical protein